MKEKMLKYLCCPECSSNIELARHKGIDSTNHITEGELVCTGCKNTYPIISGVPFFCLNTDDKTVDLNRKNFASEWNYFTSSMGDKNEQLAKDELESYFSPFVQFKDLEDKSVLEGGCGGGRLVYAAAKYSGAKEIIGVDLSNAVITAFKNTRHLPNVSIIQADITNLPFKKDKMFDFIYSVGVLHHMPNPYLGFSSLVEHLKKDGKILAWVYGKEGNSLYINFADPIRKLITSRFPFKVNLYLSCFISLIVWGIILGFYSPLNLILKEKNTNKVLPFNEYFNYFRKRGFKDFWRTVFDKMVPTISYYISHEEFKTWFEKSNLEYETYFRNGHSWTGIGKSAVGLSRDSDLQQHGFKTTYK